MHMNTVQQLRVMAQYQLRCVVQRLRGQVSSLKGSRDKLLLEVDRQSLEIERLLADNSALEQVSEYLAPNTLLSSQQHHPTASYWHDFVPALTNCMLRNTPGHVITCVQHVVRWVRACLLFTSVGPSRQGVQAPSTWYLQDVEHLSLH